VCKPSIRLKESKTERTFTSCSLCSESFPFLKPSNTFFAKKICSGNWTVALMRPEHPSFKEDNNFFSEPTNTLKFSIFIFLYRSSLPESFRPTKIFL